MKLKKTITALSVLLLGSIGFVGAESGTPYPVISPSDNSTGFTSLSGTVQSLQKTTDGLTQIELKDSLGRTNLYTVQKDVDVRDTKDRKIAFSKVVKGSSITLSLQGNQITQIYLGL